MPTGSLSQSSNGHVSYSDALTKSLQSLDQLSRGKRTVFGTPIPWIAEPVFAFSDKVGNPNATGVVVAPAYGAANQVIIASYQVPRGYSALICGLVLGYNGGAVPQPGQILYSVDVNNSNAAVSPIPAGAYVEKDYASIPFQLGTFVGGPVWPVEFKHDQNETVRIKGQTVATVPTGVGNFLFGALIGFQWPTMGWEG